MTVRYDTAQINKIEVDPNNGFVHIHNVPIARTGVFPYLQADGSTVMEAKLPKDLLSPSTVESTNNKPVTDNHPPDMVNRTNVNQYMKGFTANNAHVDNDVLKVDMTITDDKLIKEISQGKEELSIGFKTELLPKKGTFSGETYDCVQSNIQINHVAVVDKGRAGHRIRLTGDSATMVLDKNDNKEFKANMELEEVLLDGNTVSVAKKDAETVAKANGKLNSIEQQIESKQEQIKQLQEDIKNLRAKQSNGKVPNDNDEKSVELKKKSDALEKTKAELDTLKDNLDNMLEAKIEVRNNAQKFLGDSYDFKGKSDRQIKVDAIKTVKKDFDDTNMEDSRIDGIFTALGWSNPSTPTAGWRGVGDSKEDYTQDAEDDAYNKLWGNYNNGGAE